MTPIDLDVTRWFSDHLPVARLRMIIFRNVA
jgi:hypothetical protein